MDYEKKTISIGNINYCDSNGSPVPKEKFDEEREKFQEYVGKRYEEEMLSLIEVVPENGSETEKLSSVFDYLLGKIAYDHDQIQNSDGTISTKIYNIYNNWGVEPNSKFAPLLTGKGICEGIAPMIDDICSRIGIESKVITGVTKIIDSEKGTRLQHAWNIVKIGDDYKHLDLVYAMYNLEDGKDPYDYFLVDDEKLSSVVPHSYYEDQIPSVTKKGGNL